MKVLLFILIIGCASSKKECSDKNFTTCSHKQNELPGMNEIGLWNYCTYKYGHKLGKNGVTKLDHCPFRKRALFLQGYSEGRKEHLMIHFKESQEKAKTQEN